jgi:hypothetical protein
MIEAPPMGVVLVVHDNESRRGEENRIILEKKRAGECKRVTELDERCAGNLEEKKER